MSETPGTPETPDAPDATAGERPKRRAGWFVQQGADGPRWRRPVLFAVGAVVIIAAAAVTWVATSPQLPPAAITVTKVYVPPTTSDTADVYFTISNTGAGPDTLESVGAEYQTAKAVKSITLCSDDPCSGPATINLNQTTSTLFAKGGPHIEVTGLGPLAKGHQPLQLTLDFQRSGTLHVLAPIGTAADLNMMDVMTYGFMGHATPGDGMDMSGGTTTTMGSMPGMTGMNMPGSGG